MQKELPDRMIIKDPRILSLLKDHGFQCEWTWSDWYDVRPSIGDQPVTVGKYSVYKGGATVLHILWPGYTWENQMKEIWSKIDELREQHKKASEAYYQYASWERKRNDSIFGETE